MIDESYIGRSTLPEPKSEREPAASKPKRRRRKPLTQAELHRRCKSAVAVHFALIGLADANRFVYSKRETIADATGIRKLRTISTAIRELERGGWIRVWRTTVGGADGFATLLKIRVVFMGAVYGPS